MSLVATPSFQNHPVHTELKQILVVSGCLAKPFVDRWSFLAPLVMNPVVNALSSLLTSNEVKGRSSSNALYAHAHAYGPRGP